MAGSALVCCKNTSRICLSVYCCYCCSGSDHPFASFLQEAQLALPSQLSSIIFWIIFCELSCEKKDNGGRGCCCSDHPVALCLRERQLWQGAQGQDNQAIYRLGNEDQSVLYKVLAKLSLSSSKKRKLQKDSREPGGKTTNHQAMNIKTGSSSTKAAAVPNNCCPTATIVWSVFVCYKVLQGATRCYKML